jgi:hypothetical protein
MKCGCIGSFSLCIDKLCDKHDVVYHPSLDEVGIVSYWIHRDAEVKENEEYDGLRV